MTKYAITFNQNVVETCYLEIEADSADEALAKFKSGQAYNEGYEVFDSDMSETYNEIVEVAGVTND